MLQSVQEPKFKLIGARHKSKEDKRLACGRGLFVDDNSTEGADAHKVLMSIKETCNVRGLNFYEYVLDYPSPHFKTVNAYQM